MKRHRPHDIRLIVRRQSLVTVSLLSPQVLTSEGALMTQPEYVLRFQPPLTISNLLPFDMTVIVTDR